MGTLKKEVKFSGKGIHSGAIVNMVVKPSNRKGIFFKRTDVPDSKLIPARFDNVGETKLRNTTVGDINGAHVKTIEHLMAAFFMAGIDNAIVEIDGSEIPILDGSCANFYNAFIKAGVKGKISKKIIVKKEIVAYSKELARQISFFDQIKIKIANLLSGHRGNGYVRLLPNDKNSLDITATLIYPEKIISSQTYFYSYDGSKKSAKIFLNNLSRARTFGKYNEWEYLKKHGMARGADETNVIALNNKGDGTINSLHWKDEFVRHKIIDIIGDMFTSGGFIIGKVESFKGSHALDNLVLKKLFSNPENYDTISVK